MFIGLLSGLINASNHTKCVSLSIQKCVIQLTLINLHPNEYSQELHYYPFAVNLDRCVGSCSTLNDLLNKVCVSNKTEDLKISMFNMITGINESKTLTKHISCQSKCKLDGRKCNSNQKCNNDKCGCKCKIMWIQEKDYILNHVTCSCTNGKYLASIIDDSVITCDEIIDPKATSYNKETKHFQQILTKKVPFKTKKYIYFACLFINYYSIIDYCYLIKYKSKQKNILPYCKKRIKRSYILKI